MVTPRSQIIITFSLMNYKLMSCCLALLIIIYYSSWIDQVTWIEHVEVDDRAVHSIYRPLVNSGLAFGAKRWVATLERQCERLASSMANNIPAGDLCGM